MLNFKNYFIILIAFWPIITCIQKENSNNKTENNATSQDSLSYIENAHIKVGINLKLGGAISYLADPSENENIINNFDWGRQIQMSFYGYPIPFKPDGKEPHEQWKNLGWNPIQSGDVGRYRSKVLDYQNSGNTLYVKSRPMHWPLENQPCECIFETWIKIEQNTAKVHSRLNNARSDKKQYPARSQELPAIYNNAPYWKLMTYKGDKPFTNGDLSQIPKKEWDETGPWRHWLATENWAANVNDKNWGLGVWTPENFSYIGGFAGELGTNGRTLDYPTAYISPLNREILDHNIVYEYDYILILGTLKEIRNYVYEHADKHYIPHYVFEKDRQHWTYKKAHDQGWPVKKQLNITLDNKNAIILGPTEFWKAKNTPQLTIVAAFKTETDSATILWKTFKKREFSPERSTQFKIKTDGKFHTYNINLSTAPGYKGSIIQIAIKPEGQAGDKISLKSISFQKQ